MSILSCILLADWQAVPYDKCTEFSLYHHKPFQTNDDSDMLISSGYSTDAYFPPDSMSDVMMTCEKESNNNSSCSQGCYMVKFLPGNPFDIHKYHCEEIPNLEHVDSYVCNWNGNTSFCMFVNSTLYTKKKATPSIQHFLKGNLYRDLQSHCTTSIVNGDYCHWTPDSLITKQYCNECQPICRSLSHSLNFVQFCFGAAILMISIPIAWVPVASIVSEKTKSEMQVIYPHLLALTWLTSMSI